MSEVTITVSGPVGSGKSALVGEIEILMRALGVPVLYADPKKESYEKNVRAADWQSDLEMYKPSVLLVEAISSLADGPTEGQVLQALEKTNITPEQSRDFILIDMSGNRYPKAWLLRFARHLLAPKLPAEEGGKS